MTDEHAGITLFTGEDEGPDDDGYPRGLLRWGQAGVYNAVDDRSVISALSDSVSGIVKPCRVDPGPGLTITTRPGWLGIADCGDGTTAVAGSRQTWTLGPGQGVMSGPITGDWREDVLWCDTYPDEGQWRLSVIRQAETFGRAGLPLARIRVPPGANLASQFEFSRMVPTFGAHAESTMQSWDQTYPWSITPHYPIAPWMIRPRSHFRLRAFGWGKFGAAVNHLVFQPMWADRTPQAYLETTGLGWNPGEEFSWEAEIAIQCRMSRANHAIKMSAAMSVGQGPGSSRAPAGKQSNTHVTNLAVWDPDVWHWTALEAWWTGWAANQVVECVSSTFETIEPWEG